MLEAAGVSVECVGAQVDERALEAEMADAQPAEIAQALGAAKASAVSQERPGALVLGGDSLVVCDERRFDKPANRDEAAEHLRFFSGKVMRLHSAAALARDGRIVWLGEDSAALHVRELSDEFIESYLAAEWPAVGQSVGVFRIEAMGVQLFDRIFGDYFTILGMPLLQVLAALRDEGELAS
ncbi:7-methyl-GTP pyrophosphatase [Alteriqipengyuania sp. 357]